MRKILILIIVFYILILLQTSFLVHFSIFRIIPNLILISVILINFLEEPDKTDGILSAFIGGFFLDIFSKNFFGFEILILVGMSYFIKLVLKRHVQIPIIQNYSKSDIE